MIIGITGTAGSGKDTAAELICSILKDNCKVWHFADPLKQMCIDYLGLTYDDLYTREGKTKFNEFWKMTNREILQKIGTDCFRNNFCKDFYCKLLEIYLKTFDKKVLIVPDVRFDNEAETIKKNNGIIIKIDRENHELTNKEIMHESEQGISEKLIDYNIDNSSTLDILLEKINIILKEYNYGEN